MHTIPGAVVVVGLLLASCRGAPPPQDRVDFIFTDGEWESYQSRIEEGSRKEFSLSVRLGAHQDYVRATAHLRGASSFNCARRIGTELFAPAVQRNSSDFRETTALADAQSLRTKKSLFPTGIKLRWKETSRTLRNRSWSGKFWT